MLPRTQSSLLCIIFFLQILRWFDSLKIAEFWLKNHCIPLWIIISKKRWYSSNIKGIRLWDGKIQIRKRIRSNQAFDIQENFAFLIKRIILSINVDQLHFASCLPVLSANIFEDISETGRHNLRSFLAANSIQNYFLIARMLIILWHSRQKYRT